MTEQVTIIPIRITRPLQQYGFQHRLPRTTAKIIGIETGVRIGSVLTNPWIAFESDFKRNVLLGSVQLQLNGLPNLFWGRDIYADDNNTGFGELPAPAGMGGPQPMIGIKPPLVTGKSFFQYHDCTHGTKKEEETLDICGSRLINGIYRDNTGQLSATGIRYDINLYLWTQNSLT
jgi:hypothetical protein